MCEVPVLFWLVVRDGVPVLATLPPLVPGCVFVETVATVVEEVVSFLKGP